MQARPDQPEKYVTKRMCQSLILIFSALPQYLSGKRSHFLAISLARNVFEIMKYAIYELQHFCSQGGLPLFENCA